MRSGFAPPIRSSRPGPPVRIVGTGTTDETHPNPSWPVSFLPHPYAMPLSDIATEWQAEGDVATSAIFARAKIDGKRMVGECSS